MGLADRLARLFRGDAPGGADASARIVVVDTETTGLDAASDALLAIGGVAVDDDGVDPADSFDVVLKRTGPVDPRNAALHGIGARAQSEGTPAGEALDGFTAWAAGARCVAFHAEFDRRVLRRAFASAGLAFDERPWLDLAGLAASLEPARWRGGARSLDDWLAAYAIGTDARHNAAGDALATAELYLRLRAMARVQGLTGYAQLLRASTQRRWLGGDR
jgi:DNA polymerase-3 subunit epsilon